MRNIRVTCLMDTQERAALADLAHFYRISEGGVIRMLVCREGRAVLLSPETLFDQNITPEPAQPSSQGKEE